VTRGDNDWPFDTGASKPGLGSDSCDIPCSRIQFCRKHCYKINAIDSRYEYPFRYKGSACTER
jgi:hypothetical protein